MGLAPAWLYKYLTLPKDIHGVLIYVYLCYAVSFGQYTPILWGLHSSHRHLSCGAMTILLQILIDLEKHNRCFAYHSFKCIYLNEKYLHFDQMYSCGAQLKINQHWLRYTSLPQPMLTQFLGANMHHPDSMGFFNIFVAPQIYNIAIY